MTPCQRFEKNAFMIALGLSHSAGSKSAGKRGPEQWGKVTRGACPPAAQILLSGWATQRPDGCPAALAHLAFYVRRRGRSGRRGSRKCAEKASESIDELRRR